MLANFYIPTFLNDSFVQTLETSYLGFLAKLICNSEIRWRNIKNFRILNFWRVILLYKIWPLNYLFFDSDVLKLMADGMTPKTVLWLVSPPEFVPV